LILQFANIIVPGRVLPIGSNVETNRIKDEDRSFQSEFEDLINTEEGKLRGDKANMQNMEIS
jgi:hypothetical protein